MVEKKGFLLVEKWADLTADQKGILLVGSKVGWRAESWEH